MKIEYTYKVTQVDEKNNHMILEFSAEGYTNIVVGARLPVEGETLADVAAMYVPQYYWEMQKKTFVVPEVGTTGSGTTQ